MRSVKNLLIYTLMIALPTLSLASGRIVWDVSHTALQGYNLAQNYHNLALFLADNGFTVSELSNDLEETGLWNADVFVVSALSNYETPYSEAEIALVEHFVRAGGGLLILADNNAARPRNLMELARRFGILSSRDDRIENLSRFAEGELFAGIDSVTLLSGSALELVNQGGASALAYDGADRIGIATKAVGAGKVIVLGDADLWTDEFLRESDNTELATSLFNHLNRTPLGRIALPDSSISFYLPIQGTYTMHFALINNGAGDLEYGLATDDNSAITFSQRLGTIPAGETAQIEYHYKMDDLEANRIYDSQIIIHHNDPTQGPVVYGIEVHALSTSPTHFEIPANTGIDHSLLISSVSIEDIPAQVGLEVGVFTPEGFCAGAGRYLNEALGIATRGDNPLTDDIDGFRRNEDFRFKLFTPWDEIELAVNPTLIEGNAEFIPDGFSVFVLDGRGSGQVSLDLTDRWSLVSLNVTPGSLSPRDILAPLLENDMLMMVKDGDGHFWDVERNFSNLGEWNLLTAYQIKVRQPTEITISGAEIDATQPIALRNRWNSVAYLPQEAIPTAEALASIEDNLEVVKRGDGAFYLPRFNWDGIGALEPGRGYQMRLSGAADLTYPAFEGRLAAAPRSHPYGNAPSDHSMSLLVMNISPGSSVVVISGGLVICSGIADQSGRVGLPVWADDPATPEIEGISEGARVDLIVAGKPISLKWLIGDGTIHIDDVAVAEAIAEPFLAPDAFDVELSPNPFNDRVLLKISNITSDFRLEIFDTKGRQIVSQTYHNQQTSSMNIVVPGDGLPSGVLLVRLSSAGSIVVAKAVHLP